MKKAVLILFFGLSVYSSLKGQSLKHPGVLLDKNDFIRLKANIKIEPWRSGYEEFRNLPQASAEYKMRGPFVSVGREKNENLKEYESDVLAIYLQAVQWQLTGKEVYAKNAIKIIDAWSTTHMIWTGSTPRLAAGWNSTYFAAGAEILRYTYPGWTSENTERCRNYFINIFWPMIGGDKTTLTLPNLADANQGAMELRGAMAMAVFCDDKKMFDNVVDAFVNHPCGGLVNSTLPSGQFSDFGRDMVHAGGMLQDFALAAETAYKQGVDLYSLLDNRMYKCMEYYMAYLLGKNVPFVPFGACYGLYTRPSNDKPDPEADRAVVRNWGTSFALYKGAYTVRKNMEMPNLLAYEKKVKPSFETFLYTKDMTKLSPDPGDAGVTIAVPGKRQPVFQFKSEPIGVGTQPEIRLVNDSYTLEGTGKGTDKFNFAYTLLQGNGTLIAHLANFEAASPEAMAGLMIRQGSELTSPFVEVFMKPTPSGSFFNGRLNVDGKTSRTARHPAAKKAPYWLKLERRGSTMIGYDSADGINWTPVRFLYGLEGKNVQIGLMVNSGDDQTIGKAIFDQVSLFFN